MIQLPLFRILLLAPLAALHTACAMDIFPNATRQKVYRVAWVYSQKAETGSSAAKEISRLGITITPSDLQALVKGKLDRRTVDAVVFSGRPGSAVPLNDEGKAALMRFLKAGGDLVLLGVQLPPLAVSRETLAIELFREDDPNNNYTGAVEVVSSDNSAPFPMPKPLVGPFSGTSALGPAIPNEVKFVPLLAARDSYARTLGWAGGLLVHYSGAFQGGQWAIFRVNDEHFYSTPDFQSGLAALFTRLASDDLPTLAAKEDAVRKTKTITLKTPPPHQEFVRVSADGQRLEAAGMPLFITGCFYDGGSTRGLGTWGGKAFDAGIIEGDFLLLKNTGINAIRMFGDAGRDQELKELLRRHRMYLLYEMSLFQKKGQPPTTVEEMADKAKAIAARWKDEPMLAGYDLQNEPYLYYFATLTLAGKPSPLIAAKPYSNPEFSGLLQGYSRDRAWVDRAMKKLPSYIFLPHNLPPELLREVLAGYAILGNYADLEGSRWNGMGGPQPFRMPNAAKWKPFLKLADDSIRIVLEQLVSAIREVDSKHLITVGYNNISAFSPANGLLDFNNFHFYYNFSPAQSGFHEARGIVERTDLFRAAFPYQPVTRGELGASTGYRETDKTGPYWRADAAGLFETATYLRDYNQGYSGNWRWISHDQYLPLMPRRWPWVDWKLDASDPQTTKEARFGLYYYDGSPHGRPKPLAHALRFLREAIDDGLARGKFAFTETKVFPNLGYRFHAPGAIIAGNHSDQFPEMQFDATGLANIFLLWNADRTAKLASTADTLVTLSLDRLFPGHASKDITLKGISGQWKVTGSNLVIQLLAGERVTIRLTR